MASIRLDRLAPAPGSRRPARRLGCGSGSGRGQTSTRGQKGQRSRSGDGKLVGFEGGQSPLLRRLPKRGFNAGPSRRRYQEVNLEQLDRVFANQLDVSLDALRLHRLIHGADPVKVLGGGSLGRPLKVTAHAFSQGARQKIEAAGGQAVALTWRGRKSSIAQ